MTSYRAVCGSRCYGIETEQSDYDIVLSGTHDVPVPYVRAHNIRLEEERFLRMLLLLEPDAYFVQYLFPSEVLDDTEAARYILRRAEDIAAANRGRIYAAYMKKAEALGLELELWWQKFPKRAVYSCLFYDTVHRFATQDISFAEAFRPGEELRQWLLAVRRREIQKEEILNRNAAMRRQAEAVQWFYAGKEDRKVLRSVAEDMNALLGTEIRITGE